MNVSLTPELDKYIHGKVASGRYSSASEVVREALRAMVERDSYRTYVQGKIDRGLADLEAGRYVEGSAEELGAEFLNRAHARNGIE